MTAFLLCPHMAFRPGMKSKREKGREGERQKKRERALQCLLLIRALILSDQELPSDLI